MRKALTALALASLTAGTVTTFAVPAAAQAAAEHYSVSKTEVGTLLDDPAAVEVLKKLIPSVYGNEMFRTQGRALTLKDIQTYESEALSDENLAKIQAEFDKLPVKKK